MKSFTKLSCAALALLLSGSAFAGQLIPAASAFSFTPAGVFSNNTIQSTNVSPSLLKIFGNTTITQGATLANTVIIQLSGTFNSNLADIFSAGYNFNLSLASAAPVTFTVNGFAQATIAGIPVGPETQVFTRGGGVTQTGAGTFANYTGSAASTALPAAGTGNFRVTLQFNFSAPAAGDVLSVTIPQNSIDISLAPTAIPEPSTYALLGVGLVGLAYSARRRLTA